MPRSVKRLDRPWSRAAGVVVVAALLSAVAGCGSRLTTEEIRAGSVVSGGRSADGAVADAGPGEQESVSDVGDAPTATTIGGAGAPTAAGGATDAAGQAPAARAGGPKSPIIIGYVGWLSGTGGETMSPTRDVWVAWSRVVNARGGINGHPVQLLVGDHGGNESRAVSIARDFVENKGAIALTHGSGGPAISEYAKSKGVPIVGTVMTGGTSNTNPMVFPPYGSAENTTWGTIHLIKRAGKTKMASVYCAESGDCEDGAQRIKREAAAQGIQVVSEQRYSVTAPDYTAECIQMRSAGAEIVYPTGDTGSMIRMAKACARQNFRPIWISPTMNDAVAKVPEFENAIALSPALPWFLRGGSPAVDEYVQALQKYVPSRLTNGNVFMGWAWVSAKLFEKAAQKVGDKPTSQDILEGLWSMKGETLGGLTPGKAARTFTRNQPTPETYCVFEGRMRNGKWEATQGLAPICR
jgi:branched-chain amino acid transport system substrate-binding protein